jgi:hypothetical protein
MQQDAIEQQALCKKIAHEIHAAQAALRTL